MGTFSIEIDNSNSTALAHVLKKLEDNILDFAWDWKIKVNSGGIDYGIYLNIDTDEKQIEICNLPKYNSDGDDTLEDVFNALEDEEDEDDDDEC